LRLDVGTPTSTSRLDIYPRSHQYCTSSLTDMSRQHCSATVDALRGSKRIWIYAVLVLTSFAWWTFMSSTGYHHPDETPIPRLVVVDNIVDHPGYGSIISQIRSGVTFAAATARLPIIPSHPSERGYVVSKIVSQTVHTMSTAFIFTTSDSLYVLHAFVSFSTCIGTS